MSYQSGPIQQLDMLDAEVLLWPELFSAKESQELFQTLMDTSAWEQKQVELETATVTLPRLIAWYGDTEKGYAYSGVTVQPHPWTPVLLAVRQRVEETAGQIFNSVLLNLYRNEQDSVSWHSDDEPELGENPVIASVSFGAVRTFQFKHKDDPEKRLSIELPSGSLLLMRGTTQKYWKHRVAKTKEPCGPRINLTFRVLY